MSEESQDPLNEEEARIHPRILLLDEFGGEIISKQKYFKSLYHYREEVDDIGIEEWPFQHKSFGPTEEGLSKILKTYDDCGLVVVEKTDEYYVYKQTEKGSRFAEGLRRGLRMLRKDYTKEREKSLELVAKLDKDRSGSEIADDIDIQKKKSEPFGIDQ
ncbi:hypothetical protein HZS55_20400 [Halosimplex rubrum]|uniref:Uncharacterized protein n=1 Tax=Halosimplex rubrum TaxID=869889 RepID=A0A7D5TP73_9EURY|nr:hypothetical protein [Halosimplex rubrum]QLH79512.1 hypothetical protein HZS55_20400 [Halosimplex rubrum]